MTMTASSPATVLAAWRRDRAFWVCMIPFGLLVVAALVMMASVIPAALREERRLNALSPAERAVERHVMPDGTVCYQPRAGWSRPLSCVRP